MMTLAPVLRVLFLIFFLGFAAYLVVGIVHVTRLVRIGRVVAARARPFERIVPDAAFRVLVVGDSTAVGTGAADPRGSVAGRLGARFSESSIENRGVNGLLTKEIVGNLPANLPQRYDLVVIHAGGNDILRFTPLSALRTDIERLLERAKGLGKTIVLLTTGDIGRAPLFPRLLGAIFTRRTRLVREVFRDAAQAKGVHYVDLFVPEVNDVFASDPRRYYAADFLHPSGEGYEVWFQAVEWTLQETGLLQGVIEGFANTA